MANFFSYPNSPEAPPPPAAPQITQQDDSGSTPAAAPATEHFDEVAEADLEEDDEGRTGEWVLPDPANFHEGEQHQTPLDQLAAAAARAATLCQHTVGDTALATPTNTQPDALRHINAMGGNFTPAEGTTPRDRSEAASISATHRSALISTCHHDLTIRTSSDLIASWNGNHAVGETARNRKNLERTPSRFRGS